MLPNEVFGSRNSIKDVELNNNLNADRASPHGNPGDGV